MTRSTKERRGQNAYDRGRIAEVLCLTRLWLTGWSILGHRLVGKRGTGLGEIDIVARRGSTIAFIEVKARNDDASAREAVSATQRKRIETAAQTYLARHPKHQSCDVRFDVMILTKGVVPHRIADAWRPES